MEGKRGFKKVSTIFFQETRTHFQETRSHFQETWSHFQKTGTNFCHFGHFWVEIPHYVDMVSLTMWLRVNIHCKKSEVWINCPFNFVQLIRVFAYFYQGCLKAEVAEGCCYLDKMLKGQRDTDGLLTKTIPLGIKQKLRLFRDILYFNLLYVCM